MEYTKTKRVFASNELRSSSDIAAISADLNSMTIENLSREADFYFLLKFFKFRCLHNQ